METIKAFLKFGNKENILDLYENGTIFMNSIQWFREHEASDGRGDSYEGAVKIYNYLSGTIEIPSIGFKGRHTGVHLKESTERVLGNIYSLYCISSKGWENPFDVKINEKVLSFGSYCLMVKDNKKFWELMIENLKKSDLKFYHGFVKYYDKKAINREISLFEKPLEYEYQKEFRFYVERKSTEPYVLKIGSLKEIADVYTSKEVIHKLKITNQPK